MKCRLLIANSVIKMCIRDSLTTSPVAAQSKQAAYRIPIIENKPDMPVNPQDREALDSLCLLYTSSPSPRRNSLPPTRSRTCGTGWMPR